MNPHCHPAIRTGWWQEWQLEWGKLPWQLNDRRVAVGSQLRPAVSVLVFATGERGLRIFKDKDKLVWLSQRTRTITEVVKR